MIHSAAHSLVGFAKAAFNAALLLIALACFAPSAHAEQKIALVIGNADYSAIGPLSNPVNDARLIRETLEGLGFEVTYRENVDKDEMERAISVFSDKLFNAGSSGVALFYFAGHGLQSNGENFLLPVDISIDREADLRFGAIRASDVLAQMEAAQSSTKIVILDACRDNPFATRFSSGRGNRGLAEIGLGSSEFFVAYAATAGSLADDGTGANSPYAAALARRLPTPNSEISNTFRLVRVDVSAATNQRQLPEARTTMRREFYFAGEPADRPADDIAITAAPVVTAMVPTVADIVGAWCEAGRGRGLTLDIRPEELTYSVGREETRYDVGRIVATAGAKIEVEWFSRGTPITFEFGDFDSDGSMMTQLRGREGDTGEWKDYNLRFRKCPERAG